MHVAASPPPRALSGVDRRAQITSLFRALLGVTPLSSAFSYDRKGLLSRDKPDKVDRMLQRPHPRQEHEKSCRGV